MNQPLGQVSRPREPHGKRTAIICLTLLAMWTELLAFSFWKEGATNEVIRAMAIPKPQMRMQPSLRDDTPSLTIKPEPEPDPPGRYENPDSPDNS